MARDTVNLAPHPLHGAAICWQIQQHESNTTGNLSRKFHNNSIPWNGNKIHCNRHKRPKTKIASKVAADWYYVNPLIATLKPQINGPPYSTIQWLVHWPLMGELLHLVQQVGDWAGLQLAQAPPRCTKCNRSPINSQSTNFVLFDVTL